MTPWVTRLIFANVAVYLLTMASPALFNEFMLVPRLVVARPWTPLTYMFLHAGMWHLAFNMLGLFFFGPRLEGRLGERHFLGLYFFSGFMGAVLSFFFAPGAAVVGASGALFGVFLGFATFWPREKIFIWGILPVEARVLVIVMTALSLMGGLGVSSGVVAHFAHLGGFVGGFAYLKLVEIRSPAAKFKRKAAVPPSGKDDYRRWQLIRKDEMHEVNRLEFDRIMARIDVVGPEGLTPDERAFMDRFSPH